MVCLELRLNTCIAARCIVVADCANALWKFAHPIRLNRSLRVGSLTQNSLCRLFTCLADECSVGC